MESDLNCQNQAGMLTVFLLNQKHRQKLDILSIQARFEARVLSSVLYIRYTFIPLVQKNIGDLVLRSRFGGSRTKNGGGEGKGEEETRSGKIRLRGPESGPRVNFACSKSDLFFMCTVQSSSWTTRCVLLLKTWFPNFKALKTQTVRGCKGCSAAGRHVLEVLPTGYGKTLT